MLRAEWEAWNVMTSECQEHSVDQAVNQTAMGGVTVIDYIVMPKKRNCIDLNVNFMLCFSIILFYFQNLAASCTLNKIRYISRLTCGRDQCDNGSEVSGRRDAKTMPCLKIYGLEH